MTLRHSNTQNNPTLQDKDPNTNTYLFVGGPLHGEIRDIPLGQTVVTVPSKTPDAPEPGYYLERYLIQDVAGTECMVYQQRATPHGTDPTA